MDDDRKFEISSAVGTTVFFISCIGKIRRLSSKKPKNISIKVIFAVKLLLLMLPHGKTGGL